MIPDKTINDLINKHANLERELRSILRLIGDKSIRKHYGLFFKECLDKIFYNN